MWPQQPRFESWSRHFFFHSSFFEFSSPKHRARPGFEPGTSRTLSENHTPRPTSRACSQHNSNWCPSMLTPLLLGHNFGCISNSLRYGLVVRISGSHPGGPGSIPGNGKLFSVMVKWLGYLALAQVARVRFSVAKIFFSTDFVGESSSHDFPLATKAKNSHAGS